MADRKQRAVIADLSGGRNAIDPPTSPRFGANQCVEAVNVDFYRSTLGNKRQGMTASGVTFSAGGPFTGKVSVMARHVPSTDESAAELWAVDDAMVTGRKAGGTTFAAPTLKDAWTGNAWDLSFASLNGKLFVAGKTGQNRLHDWDGSTVRRTGLPAPAAPTVANSAGAGTYAAILAYWRVRWIDVSGPSVRRSEPSPATAFTPDGAHTGVVINEPALAGEGETHWEIEVSSDNATFYSVATQYGLGGVAVGVGTTFLGTTLTPAAFASGTASPLTGTYTLQKSYRFIAADQNRLLGFGSWTSTDKQNRIELSAVVGSRDTSDAERVDTTINYFVDLDENDSGDPTGLRGPVFGNFYAFKKRQFWELAPTGSTASPYRRTKISGSIGCVGGPASCIGEDAHGNPALYFMSHRGMYRYGAGGYEAGSGGQTYIAGGLQYIGKGIEDYVLGPTATINLAATAVVSHCVYHADKRQVWVWWATGASNDPNQLAIYDVTTGGWSRVPSGDKLANARCSVMASNTIAAAMSRDLKPYLGSATTANKIYKADDASATDDDGTAFQAYLDTRDFEPGGPGFDGEVGDGVLLAKAATGVTITATVIPDFDPTLAQTGTALLTAGGSETRVRRRLEGSRLSCGFVRVRLGDAAAVSNGWTLDRLVLPYDKQEAFSS